MGNSSWVTFSHYTHHFFGFRKENYLFCFLFTLTTWTIIPTIAHCESGSEAVAILPLLDYSAEKGVGFGAQALWTNIMGSGWDTHGFLISSPSKFQNVVGASIQNRALNSMFYVDFSLFWARSQRSVFYGFGNDSDERDLRQYDLEDHRYSLRLGLNLLPNVTVGYGRSQRSTQIDHGNDSGIAQIFDTDPLLPNPHGVTENFEEVFGFWDTRTPALAPQLGALVFASMGRSLPETRSEFKLDRLSLGAAALLPLIGTDLILATRVQHDHVWGINLPFYFYPRLGGQNTLRGYRTGRYTDGATLLVSAEPRWTFWSPGGEYVQRVELSFGIDAGRVSNESLPTSGFHTTYSLGLTGILKSGVPLRLDLSQSPEATLTYLSLLYPF